MALAEKIKKYINKPLTEEEKIAQIDFVTKKYNGEKIAKETLEVYKQLINQ